VFGPRGPHLFVAGKFTARDGGFPGGDSGVFVNRQPDWRFVIRASQPKHGTGDVVLLVRRQIAHSSECIIESLAMGGVYHGIVTKQTATACWPSSCRLPDSEERFSLTGADPDWKPSRTDRAPRRQTKKALHYHNGNGRGGLGEDRSQPGLRECQNFRVLSRQNLLSRMRRGGNGPPGTFQFPTDG
jgi:hypothetical protein